MTANFVGLGTSPMVRLEDYRKSEIRPVEPIVETIFTASPVGEMWAVKVLLAERYRSRSEALRVARQLAAECGGRGMP